MRYRRTAFTLALLLASLTSWAQAPPDDLQKPFAEANQKFAAGDFEGVLKVLEPFKSDPTLPPPILALLSGAYIELGRFKDAQSLLDPLVSKGLGGPAIFINAARAAFALGEDDKGEIYLKRAVERSPQSRAARALGLRYGRQGRVQDAYDLLKPWTQAHPDDLEVRLAAAFCAVELGRNSEADQLLANVPEDNAHGRLLRARLLLKSGAPQGAITMLAPMEAAPPKEIERDLRWVLGEARLQVGQAAAAVAVLEGHTGEDPVLVLLLAQAYQQSGAPEKVLATLKPIIDKLPDPSSVEAEKRSLPAALALEYGRALVTSGRFPEAVTVLEKATSLDPANAPAWQSYGQALAGAGRREEAQRALAKFQEVSQSAPKKDLATPP
ncbi:MAG TPA: tetratricopeptide repeat protein [Thermoanaerobaculia bacterium]|nr:tetratricopeptide repeat protein [Thermoanaerobaculia bacterium]